MPHIRDADTVARGLALSDLGVLDRDDAIAWRYSRPNTISVARREAVAALDRLVGPKY